MRKMPFLLVGLAVTMVGCATMMMGGRATIPDQNRVFQNETGISMTTLSRSLFSFSNNYGEAYHEEMYRAYMAGQVLLFVDESQQEKARYTRTDEGWEVTINSASADYDTGSKWMYLTLILGTIAQIESEGLEGSDEARARFFEAPSGWSEDFTSLYAEPWFEARELNFAVGIVE